MQKLKRNSNPRNRVGCYESAKAKFKKPRCGQACHAKVQTDQGVSNSFRIVWPTTISQENTKPRRCTQKQESMLATDHYTRFRRHNQLRKTSLKLRTSSSTPPVVRNVSPFHLRRSQFLGVSLVLGCFLFLGCSFWCVVCVCVFVCLPPRARSFELCANSMQSLTTVGAVMARTAWEKKKSNEEFIVRRLHLIIVDTSEKQHTNSAHGQVRSTSASNSLRLWLCT